MSNDNQTNPRQSPPTSQLIIEGWSVAGPSPAAVAWATRLKEETFRDIYALAVEADKIAEEARNNERRRIFNMGFLELAREFWKGKKLYEK